MAPRMLEIKCSNKMQMLSKIHHHLPWIVLGRQVYFIDESLFKRRHIHNNNNNNNNNNVISPFKRQRHERHNNKDDDDVININDLPNNILHHILSFLPTKDAVKTSILATNWRYLWTYLSDLDFQMLSIPQILHHRFPLTMSTLRNITPSLTQLSLQLAKTTLSIPTGIQFPSLKTLNLSYATFANNNSLEHFLSRCPLLQDLTLNYCYLFYINKITIAISTLTKLTIHIDAVCLNSHDFDNYLVEIDAVNLLSLTCTSLPTIQFRIVNPPVAILDAYIGFSTNTLQRIDQHVSPCSLMLLSGLANVKSLTLSNGFFQIPLYKSDHLHLLPEFYNLKHLCLGLKLCLIPTKKIVLEFLLKCPKLEVLSIPLGPGNFMHALEDPLNQVPPCFKSSLKILHISNFDECGIKFAKYLLENARLLVEIRITYSSRLLSKLNNMEDLKNQLVGMGSCAIKFQEPTCKHGKLCCVWFCGDEN